VPRDASRTEAATSDLARDSEGRFELKDILGSGAMGVVYRAHDRIRRTDVALKTLRRVDGATLYRFKNEFRALAGLVHPNLVTLYELAYVGDTWCFTMELVDGVSFLQHVRPYRHLMERLPDEEERATLTLGSISATRTTGGSGGEAAALLSMGRRAIALARLEIGRLRAALPQLVEGVAALHRAGMLHRDLKPSNVLIDRANRVVVCDFGLVIDVGDGEEREDKALGTPAYMAPEQARRQPLTEASDWYAVGVMLYDALTGTLPFTGPIEDVLAAKQERDPRPVSEVAPDTPDDLAALTMALLARDPAARPGVDAIRAVLGGGSAPVVAPSGPPTVAAEDVAADRGPGAARDGSHFIGRERELATLRAGLAAARAGRMAAILVSGRSGIGKSALIRHFLDEVTAAGDIVVLVGRCYERETVPFKALDALVDALSAHLLARRSEEVEVIVPRDAASLARLFPVLLRVPLVADIADRVALPPDPQELRQRAFGALGDILGAMAAAAVVLHIDDLQWGDSDSAPFLVELLHHPKAPLLFIGSYRDGDDAAPLVRALRGADASTGPAGLDLAEIPLEPLPPEEAQRLAASALSGAAASRAGAIAVEAAGHPLLITELARAATRSGATTGGDVARGLSLDDVLWRRIGGLPDDAIALLTAASIIGRPTAIGLLSRAAEIKDEAAALAILQAERLVRSRGAGATLDVEPYHDRIRETVLSHLPDSESRRWYRRVVRAMEASKSIDPLALVELWIGAGDDGRAGHYALAAAELAERTFAFDRAAHYYGLALRLADLQGDERRTLLIRMGDAMANAGSLAEAARAYLDATQGAGPGEAIELSRRALEQVLRSGRLGEGVELAHTVLSGVGLRFPRSRAGTLAGIVAHRAWLRLRGLDLEPRAEHEIPAEELLRIDVCWTVSSGLALVDPMIGTLFQMKHLSTALRAGDTYRSAIALCMEMGFRSTAGGPSKAVVERLTESTQALAQQCGSAHAIGLCRAVSGLAAFLRGEFVVGHDRLVEGERIMGDSARGVRWERDVAHLFLVGSQIYAGRLKELSRMVPRLLRDARDRGDEYLATGLRAWRGNLAWLVLDQADEARRNAREPDRTLRPASFHLHNYYELHSWCQLQLYTGHVRDAWERIEVGWRAIKRSTLPRIQFLRMESQFLRARCALAVAASEPAGSALRRELCREAERSAVAIEHEKMAWGVPCAAMIRGALAVLAGDRAAADARFAEAAAAADASDMALFAAVARRRRAAVIGGDEGRALEEAALAWMREQDVRNPDRMTWLLAPAPDGDRSS